MRIQPVVDQGSITETYDLLDSSGSIKLSMTWAWRVDFDVPVESDSVRDSSTAPGSILNRVDFKRKPPPAQGSELLLAKGEFLASAVAGTVAETITETGSVVAGVAGKAGTTAVHAGTTAAHAAGHAASTAAGVLHRRTS